MSWKAAETFLKCASLVAVIIVVSTIVLVVTNAAPPIQLITVPIALLILLQSQLALANARRHVRLGDPNPTTWADIFRIT
jgi:hypothetical protein